MELIERLLSNLRKNSSVNDQYAELITEYLQSLFAVPSAAAPRHSFSLSRLLTAASIFAQSPFELDRDKAFHIVTAAVRLNDGNVQLASIASLIFSRLGNFPASLYLEDGSGSELLAPLVLEIEKEIRRENNTVRPLANVARILTDFQHDVWLALEQGLTVSVSAPTSAGKSYVLQSFLEASFARSVDHFQAAYLVPTRALIAQIAFQTAERLRRDGVVDFSVLTVPPEKLEALPSRVLYVMTQERLNTLLGNHPDLSLDFLVVDEAQQIEDNSRGILLSTVVDELLARNARMQIFFAMPNVANPGELIKHFALRNAVERRSSVSPVGQNLLFIDRVPGSRRLFDVRDKPKTSSTPIARVQTSEACDTDVHTLTNLALTLGGTGSNLVYANTPSSSENIADAIAARYSGSVEPAEAQLRSLAEFLGQEIHPKHTLVRTIPKGVACHFGSMPPLARQAVEEAFQSRQIGYLVTTSTLLYGVNLPARNIFLHKPRRGKDALTTVDFWNLAGRAGRLGQELDGNVFLVDYDSWPSDPLKNEKEQNIEPALTRLFRSDSAKLIEYGEGLLSGFQPYSGHYENAISKLVTDYERSRLQGTLERSGVSSPIRELVFSMMQRFATMRTLPASVTDVSPTVPNVRQEALYRAFREAHQRRALEPLIPVHPQQGSAYRHIAAAFQLAEEMIEPPDVPNNSYKFFAFLALVWMKGLPVPQIIDQCMQYRREHGGNTTLQSIIREVLRAIESDIRFRYVRMMTCYTSVLRHYLESVGMSNVIAGIPSISSFLEVGASERIMMGLIALGLSRSTARRLAQAAPRSVRENVEPLIEWLRSSTLGTLPELSRREVRAIIA